MALKRNLVTRKIQLRFNTDNPDQKALYYKTLYRWRDICVKGANQVCSHLYFLLAQNQMIYLNEKVKLAISKYQIDQELPEFEFSPGETKAIYKLVAEREKEMLLTSNQNAFYRLLSFLYKTHIPTAILSALNQLLVKNFNSEKLEYFTGKRSLRIYKQTMPIPFQSQYITQFRDNKEVHAGKTYNNYAFTLHGIPFTTRFGRDLSNNKVFLERAFSSHFLPDWIVALQSDLSEQLALLNGSTGTIRLGDEQDFFCNCNQEAGKGFFYCIKTVKETKSSTFFMRERKDDEKPVWYFSNEYKLCDSSISIERVNERAKDGGKGEKTKLFLLATFEIELQLKAVDPDVSAECWLDLEIPIKVKIGERVIDIGNKEEFLYRRQALQHSRRRLQRAATFNEGGNGRKKKLQMVDKVGQKERRYIDSRTHQYSRKLIDILVDNKVGTLYVRDQIAKEEKAKDEEFLLRNWSYGNLREKIKYKADKVGIQLVLE